MAGSLNKVILIGNLGREPEVRFAQDGSKIVNMSIATSETWKDRTSGERKERTEWHRVVIFNDRLADVAERYLRKGTKVYLEGQLQTRKWTDNAGIEKYTTEVVLSKFRGEMVMLDGKAGPEGGAPSLGSSAPSASGPAPMGAPAGGGASGTPNANFDDLNDDIPF